MRTMSCFFFCNLLLFLLVYADTANSQIHYYITPSLNAHCPGDPCLTLSQFAADSTSYVRNETNIYLFFLPGKHPLDRELTLSHAENVLMTKDIRGNGTIFVKCSSQSGRFNITKTTFAIIKHLHFIGCGGNSVGQVERLIVEDTIFEGLEGRGTALILNKVTDASIVGSLFVSNTHASMLDHDTSTFTNQDVLNYLYRNQNLSPAVGGALYAAFSDVSIFSSTLTDNTAEIGGALFAFNSSLHIVGSTCSSNKANFGGVATTSESSVIIEKSNLSDNAAEIRGGMMVSYRDLFSISDVAVSTNSAGIDSGVIEIYESFVIITDSIVSNNTANGACGVFCAYNGSISIHGSIFTDNCAAIGGVMGTCNSSFSITNSTFTNNVAANFGGVMATLVHSSFDIASSTFADNTAAYGGIMFVNDSSFDITSSMFANNVAAYFGGVMFTLKSLFHITSSSFENNSAVLEGGVMATIDSMFNIARNTFTTNSADDRGGVMATVDSSCNITNSTFTNNSATNFGGGVIGTSDSSYNITHSTFTNNSGDFGGFMYADGSLLNITNCTFAGNRAVYGGVMVAFSHSFTTTIVNIMSSIFKDNSATSNGGVMSTSESSFINIANCTFINNSAANAGGVISASASSLNIAGSIAYGNKANSFGGIMSTIDCSAHFIDGTFVHNLGSVYTVYSNHTFSGYTRFDYGGQVPHKIIAVGLGALEEGGAITSFQSTVIFAGVSILSNSQARFGGAILAIESKIVMYGETIIANNTAMDSSGGGISLQQSDLEVQGNCVVSGNMAMRGGGIHATSSTIAVYQSLNYLYPPWTLQFLNNRAKNGGGLYLESNAKLYVLKPAPVNIIQLMFRDNHAGYGGAIYIADDTNSGACSPDNECFIQTLALHQDVSFEPLNIIFSSNAASEQGTNLFGGLLDRCIPSSFAEVYWLTSARYYSGVSYLSRISNLTAIDTISSLPVRVCFCKSDNEPAADVDCNYQPPTMRVRKGEAFTVPLVAVDQVNHSVDANIISSPSSQDGGFSEGQQNQSVGRSCSDVTYNVFSPDDSEIINLFADGPCGSSMISTRHLKIHFTNCTCPVGFEPIDSDTRCECNCDSKLSPHITDCNTMTQSLVRVGTNSWINYVNGTDPPSYVIHPNCPFDYCESPTETIKMNLNLPNGSDAQCAYNRSGVLCGTCKEHLSLSLGSSRCVPCQSHWHAVLVVILLAAIIAGILLVTALLALNLTVAVGLINGFIFYANIVAANSAVFFPSSEPSFPTVFVAWLNLDIGIDVCFFDGLDAYTKTWLQLAFPVYIISLVIIVIIVSEFSPRFARFIGKRDPIATLATLILLSYAKLLSVTITALSFAVLNYPDGSQETVWLPDGNVLYLQGRHIALVLMAMLIILAGIPYTFLLFLWQWLVRASNWKIFKWTGNTKLNAFVAVYHAPLNSKHRYWTGLLLLVRVALYITASIATSDSDKPQTTLLVTIILVGGLLFLKCIIGKRAYKKAIIDVLETVLHFNLLAFAALSLYDFKTDITKQTAVAYTSTIMTFILLVGVIIYHVYLLVRKDKPKRQEVNEYPLAPVEPAKAEVTHSVVEITNTHNNSPQPPEGNNDRKIIVVKELSMTEMPAYQ